MSLMAREMCFSALIGYQSRASLGLFLHPLISPINDYCTVREVASLVVLVSSLMARVYTAND